MLRLLLDLPGGLHFRKIQLSFYGASDFASVVKFVEACHDALECLDVTCQIYGVLNIVSSLDWLFTWAIARR